MKYIVSQLALLHILIPITASIACLLDRIHAYYYARTSIAICMFVSIACSLLLSDIGSINYAFGAFNANVGIEYQFTAAGCKLAGCMSAILWFLIAKDITNPKLLTCMLTAHAGALGIIFTQDIFNLYVFIEIFSISTYVCIALSNLNSIINLRAALNYLLVGGCATTIMLLGIAIIWRITDALNLNEVTARLPNTNIAHIAFIFFMSGVMIKLGAAPYHGWLSRIYRAIPFSIFGYLFAVGGGIWLYTLKLATSIVYIPGVMYIGATTALYCAICACLNTDARAQLTYIGISSVGNGIVYIVLDPAGATLYIMYDCLIKLGLLVSNRNAVLQFVTAAAHIGLPFTIGFTNKYHLLLHTLERQHYWIAVAIAFTNALSCVYWYNTYTEPDTAQDLEYIMLSVILLLPTFSFLWSIVKLFT